jgi:AcrR family transcriptional regulator
MFYTLRMVRAEIHSEDDLLDSARSVVVHQGARGATVAAVKEASGAPIGSIYHRFGSLDELLARAWIRAARRSQAAGLVAEGTDPIDTVVAAAVALYDFCIENREDAVLLASFKRDDFAESDLPDGLRLELEHLNDPVLVRLGQLARLLFGRANRSSIDLLLVALVDVPYAFARRYLDAGARPPASQRQRLQTVVHSLLDQG